MEPATNKRRSQRLFLQVRVVLEWKRPNKSPSTEETHTIVVSAHGALVEMGVSLDQGQIVTLQNVRTTEKSLLRFEPQPMISAHSNSEWSWCKSPLEFLSSIKLPPPPVQ